MMKNVCSNSHFFKSIAILLLFILCYEPSNAQYNIKENNNWTFGYRTHLDFNNGTPVASALLDLPGGSGNATVSDSSGKLLFYTNGYAIWNKNNQLMPNGDSIFSIAGRLSPFAGAQGALIVPVLSNPNQYYVFSQEATSNSPYVFGPTLGTTDSSVSRLWYSIVDMTLNSGLGDVVSGKKSILIDSALNGTMVAVRGTECNIWVLTHTIDSSAFRAYNVTAAGLDLNPKISLSGSFTNKANSRIRMTISKDGKKLAIISSGNGGGITDAGVELYDFNAATGMVSNAMYIDQIGGSGIAFSPDNSKLYVTGVVPVTYTYSMFQFDVTQTTATAIKNSRQIILAKAQWLDLRLAPDGKIYHIIDVSNMGVINSPNSSGTACNYVANVLTSSGPPWAYQFTSALPAEYVKAIPADSIFAKSLDTLVCPDFGSMILHATAGSTTNLWDDSSTGDKRTITQPGTYYVSSAIDFCTNRIDTFIVKAFDVTHAVISVSGFVLSTATQYSTYQWLLNGVVIPGATNSQYTVTQNGEYTVIVETENGCRDTSDIYTVTNAETGIHDVNAIEQQINIYPNPSQDLIHVHSPVVVDVRIMSIEGKLIKEKRNATNVSINELAEGVYLMHIKNKKGNLLKVVKFIKVK